MDIIKDSITFFPRYYMHIGNLLSHIFPKPKRMKIIFEAKNKDMDPNYTLKKESDENLDHFLKTIRKFSNKKRWLINISKKKFNIAKQKPKTVVISSFDNLIKKNLPILILILIISKSVVDIAIIDADTYCVAGGLKGAKVFTVFIKNLKFQVVKKGKPETDLKNVISKQYYDHLDVFLKKKSDTLPSHKKYNHKIILEKGEKYDHMPLYKMPILKLDPVKCYLDLYLAKRFIQAGSTPYLSPVPYVRKTSRGI